LHAPRRDQKPERDGNVFIPRVQVDPILQPEQHPQARECSYEDNWV
jgi:hypothetical protein